MSEQQAPPQGGVPRGVEVLIKKASVDPAFKSLLLKQRAGAAAEIELTLDPCEAAMVDAVPESQLEAIIARTTVPREHRRAFLGKAAAAMLAALGARTASAGTGVGGIQPDRPPTGGRSPHESRVITVLAEQLGIDAQRISPESRLTEDLKVDPKGREKIRQALEKPFRVSIPAAGFDKLRTVGEVARYLGTTLPLETRVIDIIARQLNPAQPVTRESSLSDDLKAGGAELAQLRRTLSKEFRIYIAWKPFKDSRTVGQIVDTVVAGVEKREAATAAKKRPDPPSASLGIRPNPPPKKLGAMGGCRIGPPRPEPPPTPAERAEELRRRTDEFRRQYRDRFGK